jgi:predicted O-methyltransferase YrrM
MKFEPLAAKLSGIPNMTPKQGKSVYRHILESGAKDVLEIGTAHAVSAAYMAGALEEADGHIVVTVDNEAATKLREPSPQSVLDRCGLSHMVKRVLVSDSSYTWWLKQLVRDQTDSSSGKCAPLFDFCYIDGAHNWTIDGLAFFLVEKLLRPGGWLLLDDLNWRYDPRRSSFGPGQGPEDLGLSADECSEPHMSAVYELLVRQHHSFGNFRVVGGEWGWAQKLADSADNAFELSGTSKVAGFRRLQVMLTRHRDR